MSDAVVGVLGGGSVTVDDYAEVLREHYLASYLPHGGAAVKVAVAGDFDAADRLRGRLVDLADTHDLLFVPVNAAATRVHLVDELYVEVARQVDWDGIAATVVRRAYDAIAFPAPEETDLSVATVAAHHDVDSRELYRSVRRRLEQQLLGDTAIVTEMRRAMLRLAQAQLRGGDVDDDEHAAVLAWLQGELPRVSAVRSALIFTRIGRHNARAMLAAVGRLLLGAGRGGLVIAVDYARLAESRRPPLAERDGIYYSRAAVLDAWETLRQLLDSVGDLRGILVAAVVTPSLMTDESRGLPAYTALQLRVADEVRDRRRANPFAALVRVEVRLEAVA